MHATFTRKFIELVQVACHMQDKHISISPKVETSVLNISRDESYEGLDSTVEQSEAYTVHCLDTHGVVKKVWFRVGWYAVP
jgi:hypothetical protein